MGGKVSHATRVQLSHGGQSVAWVPGKLSHRGQSRVIPLWLWRLYWREI